jgi:hypothetical protein
MSCEPFRGQSSILAIARAKQDSPNCGSERDCKPVFQGSRAGLDWTCVTECTISRSFPLTGGVAGRIAHPCRWRQFIVVGRSIEKDLLNRRLFTLRLAVLLFSTFNL